MQYEPESPDPLERLHEAIVSRRGPAVTSPVSARLPGEVVHPVALGERKEAPFRAGRKDPGLGSVCDPNPGRLSVATAIRCCLSDAEEETWPRRAAPAPPGKAIWPTGTGPLRRRAALSRRWRSRGRRGPAAARVRRALKSCSLPLTPRATAW